MQGEKSYKKVNVVGTSSDSVSDAIENAVEEADKTLDNLDWFEVEEIRGVITENGLVHQVSVKIGFRLE